MRTRVRLPSKRWLGTGISWAVPVALAGLALAGPQEGRVVLLLGAGVAAVLRARVAEWLWVRMAPQGICAACGQAIPLVARWKCSCGHLPPRPRHVFGRCYLCRKGFRWVVCPGCDGSVLL